jgi:outer membrane lipoprotein SlyB
MACVSRLIVGVFAVWLLALAPSEAAPPGRAAPAALRVDAFDVEQVASLAPGTVLQFTVFATAGASATVLVEGVRRLVELREVEPGVYEGAYVIDAADRLRAGSSAVATVWRDGAVARATLEESLLLDGAPPTPVALPTLPASPAPAVAPHALPPESDAPRRDPGRSPPPYPAGSPLPSTVQTPAVTAQAAPQAAPLRPSPVPTPLSAWSPPPPLGLALAAPPPAGRVVACRDCAVVESIRAVEVPTGPAYAGAIAGGIVGAVFGEQIGKAHERHVTSALGAIGGAVLGREIQRSATSRVGYDVALRMPNGTLRVRRYDAPPPLRVGQLLRVEPVSAAAAAPTF